MNTPINNGRPVRPKIYNLNGPDGKKIRATFFQSSPYALGSYPLMFYLNTAFAFSVFYCLMFQTKLKNIIIPFQKKF